MTPTTALLLCFSIVLILVGVFLRRNNCVYDARVDILYTPGDRGFRLYEALPSYDLMLWNPRYWTLWTVSDWRIWLERHGA